MSVTLESVLMVFGPVLGLLLMGNLFFIRDLVGKIQIAIEQQTSSQKMVQERMTKISASIEQLTHQLYETRQEVKDLKRVETDVAVLKALLQQQGILNSEGRDRGV